MTAGEGGETMRSILVGGARPYEVLLGSGLLDRTGEYVRRAGNCETAAVVADDIVDALYGDRVQASLEGAGCRVVRFRFPHGERAKCAETYVQLLGFLADSRLTRTDAVVALGGGVTGDLAGFAAATFLRGVMLVQLPTTLLAAVDSSVGGKTAIDLPQGKNMAGAFYPPSLVLCDCDTLSTLPESVFRDGCAEVIKYGVICDAELFQALRQPVWEQREAVIARCIQIKSGIVGRDEQDRGERRLLNFGHTVGHAVERCSNFAVSHGSAVSIGMAYSARAACRMGLCSPACAQQLELRLRDCGLPAYTDIRAERLLQAMLSDKKREGSRITLVLPERIGRCVLRSVPLEELADFLQKGERPL